MSINLNDYFVKEVPFADVKKEYSIQSDECVVQQVYLPIAGHKAFCRLWVVLQPNKKREQSYDLYHFGASFDPKNYFYIENSSTKAEIFKVHSHEMDKITEHMTQAMIEKE